MQLQPKPLLPDKQAAIDELFKHAGFDILLEVIESAQFASQILAAELRLNPPDSVGYKEAEMPEAAARQGAATIAILQAMRKQKETFNTNTATP